MNHPQEGNEERAGRNPRCSLERAITRSENSAPANQRGEQLPKQKVEKYSAAGVKQNVGQMKSEFVGVPKKVVQDERDVLNWPIVSRQRVEEQVMSKRFRNQKRALDDRIVMR